MESNFSHENLKPFKEMASEEKLAVLASLIRDQGYEYYDEILDEVPEVWEELAKVIDNLDVEPLEVKFGASQDFGDSIEKDVGLSIRTEHYNVFVPLIRYDDFNGRKRDILDGIVPEAWHNF